ncbi:hypothetical protein ACP70R_008343 [Stipagrostis hirtigluma subsp. patula]
METAAYPDWSGLPEELLAEVMRALAIPDLFLAGTVCASWRAASSGVRRVRFPITDAAPCLLYSARSDADAGAATLYSPSCGARFRVRLPDPPLRRRALVGSAHGWLATADEASNLHLVNPLTGAQLALPPVTALHHVESLRDEEGNLVYSVHEGEGPDGPEYPDDPEDPVDPEVPVLYPAQKLRLYLYYKVVLSCSPSAGRDCVVLLLHRPDGQLSFARIGDARWTRITDQTLKWDSSYRDAFYNTKDRLFYVLSFDGSMLTLDLTGPSPVAKDILPETAPWNDPIKDLVATPSGDMLQVWRLKETKRSDTPVDVPAEVAHEVDDPYKVSYTKEFMLFKVDFAKQKLVKITSIGDHALFLGRNSVVCIPTKDFPMLKSDCAYLTDGFDEEMCPHKHNLREIGIWNFKTDSLESLGMVDSSEWLNWPAPIWIKPSLH